MKCKKVFTFLLATTLVVGLLVPVNISAGPSIDFKPINFDYNRENTYTTYLEGYKDAQKPDAELTLGGNEFSSCDEANVTNVSSYKGKDGVIKFGEGVTWADYTVNAPEAGLYSMQFEVCGDESSKNDIEFGISINGKVPFNEANNIKVFRGWKDDPNSIITTKDDKGNEVKSFKQDNGNDLRPTQRFSFNWRTAWAEDATGLTQRPLYFYLNEGANAVRIDTKGEPFYLSKVIVKQYKEAKSYDEVLASYNEKGYKKADASIKVQAEYAFEKSNSTLYPSYVRNDPAVEPYHVSKTRINVNGAANWKNSRQWITWKIEVPKSGLYNIAIKFKQNESQGMFATRTITLDGALPFAELENVRFNYSEDWQYNILGDEKHGNYDIYLEEGEHELKMEVVLGEMAETVDILTGVLYDLNNLYRRIVMIASTTPDTYRDYNFERSIPELIPTLNKCADILDERVKVIEGVTGTKGSKTASLTNFARQLRSLSAKPRYINVRLSSFKDNVSTLSQWVIDNQAQPVTLDFFVIYGDDSKLPKTKVGFFKDLAAGVKTFFASFYEDYNVIGKSGQTNRKVRVWVGTGRDQVNIINSMINDMFTPETGISVQLELVQGSLIEATLAGKGPDVALMSASDAPVNYAIRGALVDLTQFPGFEEVTKRFQPSAFQSFKFQTNEDKDTGHVGVYAIPETQTYNMLFYRKDILAQLGLGVPETWDEFYSLLPVLNRNNLQIGVMDLIMFQTILYQMGGQYYADDKKSTGFDSEEVKEAFRQVVECFTKYSFPVTYDFYSRFRNGEMPVSIQPYTQYNLINMAAPEIKGLWDMAPVPGVRKADGTIDRQELGTVAGCIMFNGTEDKEAAWEFMKWYTSPEAQARYGLELEGFMGPAGRYPTASKEAFKDLTWSRAQSEMLTKQWNQVQGVPELPGSYYTVRGLTFAFRTAIYEGENPYKVLQLNNKDINDEIARKYEEFGLK